MLEEVFCQVKVYKIFSVGNVMVLEKVLLQSERWPMSHWSGQGTETRDLDKSCEDCGDEGVENEADKIRKTDKFAEVSNNNVISQFVETGGASEGRTL